MSTRRFPRSLEQAFPKFADAAGSIETPDGRKIGYPGKVVYLHDSATARIGRWVMRFFRRFK
jgi:hypothetical protein